MIVNSKPKARATIGFIRPVGNGRVLVLSMYLSDSLSKKLLSVFAAATVSVVPETAKNPVVQSGVLGANHHPPAAVKITRELKRGLVRSIRS